MAKSELGPAPPVDRFDRMSREELVAWAESPTFDADLLARQPNDYSRAHLKERVYGLIEVARRKSREHGVGSHAELAYLQAARRIAETGVWWKKRDDV